jgi:hypothetical protein
VLREARYSPNGTFPNYIVVVNRPNRVATLNLADCGYLGSEPLAQSASAERIVFEDGLEALSAARNAMPKNFVFCGHCLASFRWIKDS